MDGWSPTIPESTLANTLAIEAKRHVEEIRPKEVSFIYTAITFSTFLSCLHVRLLHSSKPISLLQMIALFPTASLSMSLPE